MSFDTKITITFIYYIKSVFFRSYRYWRKSRREKRFIDEWRGSICDWLSWHMCVRRAYIWHHTWEWKGKNCKSAQFRYCVCTIIMYNFIIYPHTHSIVHRRAFQQIVIVDCLLFPFSCISLLTLVTTDVLCALFCLYIWNMKKKKFFK